MAQFRQDMEALQLEEIACFAEHGITATPNPSGGVDLPPITAGEAGLVELFEQGVQECFERTGLFSWFALPLDHDAYQRMLDSRACLIAHGYEVPEPPTFEVWTESGGAWSPHGAVYDGRPDTGAGPRWTASEWAQLNADCPQPGPGVFGVGGLPD